MTHNKKKKQKKKLLVVVCEEKQFYFYLSYFGVHGGGLCGFSGAVAIVDLLLVLLEYFSNQKSFTNIPIR